MTWFSVQKMLHKSKEKVIDVYSKFIDSVVKKPTIFYLPVNTREIH